MSVPSWERELSKTQYVYEAYKMCIDIGHIVVSHPKKYRMNYGDELIKESLEVLKLCRIANSVFLKPDTPEDEQKVRRKCLSRAKMLVYNISSVADVFLGLCRDLDGVNQERIERQQRRVASNANNLINLISGVMKHDKGIMKKSS